MPLGCNLWWSKGMWGFFHGDNFHENSVFLCFFFEIYLEVQKEPLIFFRAFAVVLSTLGKKVISGAEQNSVWQAALKQTGSGSCLITANGLFWK